MQARIHDVFVANPASQIPFAVIGDRLVSALLKKLMGRVNKKREAGTFYPISASCVPKMDNDEDEKKWTEYFEDVLLANKRYIKADRIRIHLEKQEAHLKPIAKGVLESEVTLEFVEDYE